MASYGLSHMPSGADPRKRLSRNSSKHFRLSRGQYCPARTSHANRQRQSNEMEALDQGKGPFRSVHEFGPGCRGEPFEKRIGRHVVIKCTVIELASRRRFYGSTGSGQWMKLSLVPKTAPRAFTIRA